MVLSLLLAVLAASMFNVKPVIAITINPDGSISPPDAPIQRDGDVYTFTGNITNHGLLIYRSNIVVDGNGYWIDAEAPGIHLFRLQNVTIRNVSISSGVGIFAENSAHCTMYDSYLDKNALAILFIDCAYNTLFRNIIDSRFFGILLDGSSCNVFHGNNVSCEEYYPIMVGNISCGNLFYRNNFYNGTHADYAAHVMANSQNMWDNGVIGNYWRDYDGSGTHYINSNNIDHHPSLNPFDVSILPECDIGITNVVSKTVLCEGLSQFITARFRIFNYGISDEYVSGNVTVDDGQTIPFELLLRSGAHAIVAVDFETNYLKGETHTITIQLQPAPGETSLDNNVYTYLLRVSMVGDVTGPIALFIPDGKVDIRDLALVAGFFGGIYPSRFMADCDVNEDYKIDMKDIATVAIHYGEIDP